MKNKIKLCLAVCFAIAFFVLSALALDVVPKLVEDKYYVFGMAGHWSQLVSCCFWGIAYMSGFYGWLVYRHFKYRKKNG